jgi:hypothetical protein
MMKIEVGTKGKNGQGDTVTIVYHVERPLLWWEEFIGVKELANGTQTTLPLDKNGWFTGKEDHPFSLVEVIDD